MSPLLSLCLPLLLGLLFAASNAFPRQGSHAATVPLPWLIVHEGKAYCSPDAGMIECMIPIDMAGIGIPEGIVPEIRVVAGVDVDLTRPRTMRVPQTTQQADDAVLRQTARFATQYPDADARVSREIAKQVRFSVTCLVTGTLRRADCSAFRLIRECL